MLNHKLIKQLIAIFAALELLLSLSSLVKAISDISNGPDNIALWGSKQTAINLILFEYFVASILGMLIIAKFLQKPTVKRFLASTIFVLILAWYHFIFIANPASTIGINILPTLLIFLDALLILLIFMGYRRYHSSNQ